LTGSSTSWPHVARAHGLTTYSLQRLGRARPTRGEGPMDL